MCDIGAIEYPLVNTPTPTGTATETGTPTLTPTQTDTPTVTDTPTRSPTASTTPTPTVTPTATPSPTASSTPTLTATPCAGAPGKPTLLSPANSATVQVQKVPLDWNDTEYATSYTVKVKQDFKNGATVDSAKNLVVSQYTTKRLPRGHTYYWRVKACNSVGCAKSTWWSFTVSAP